MSRKRVATVAYENRRKKTRRQGNTLRWHLRSGGGVTAQGRAGTYDVRQGADRQWSAFLNGRPLGDPWVTQSAAKGWADQHEANFETTSVSESSCPCPHGEYGKSVEHHLQKMGSPDPAHDLKHSNDYVGRCQAGGIDPGMCAAVIYGAVHHHHPPSSHMNEARRAPDPQPGELWFNPHSKTVYEILSPQDERGWVRVRDVSTGDISSVSVRTHMQQYGWYRSDRSDTREDKATFRWAEVWFEHVADGALFVSRIEKVDSTIVADLAGHVVTTNATEHDVDKVLAKGGYKERFVKMDSVRRAAEEPVRWWLVVFSQLNGERGEIHVRARTADDALAKAQQDAQIDLSKQVRTIQMKSGARPDLSMGGPSPHAYEDFVAVDATGKVIGTPHKEYYRAKQEAGATGFVKYVSPGGVHESGTRNLPGILFDDESNAWKVKLRGLGIDGNIVTYADDADTPKARQIAAQLHGVVGTLRDSPKWSIDSSMIGYFVPESPMYFALFLPKSGDVNAFIKILKSRFFVMTKQTSEGTLVKTTAGLEEIKKTLREIKSDGVPIYLLQPDVGDGSAKKVELYYGEMGKRYDFDTKKFVPAESRMLEANDSAPACQPFTRVERDPAKFNACMLRAKEVGPIQGSRKIYDLVHADIEKFDEEHFLVLCLDFRGAVRDYVEINVGQRHRVATEVADILRPIILSGCDGAVVIHNHPSGDAHPSDADGKLTDSIREAMRIACPGITLLDHVVIGRGQYFSYADKKLHKV